MSEHVSTTPQKPPAASMLDALEEMRATLTALQDKSAGLGPLLTDLRDIVKESTELMHEQMREMSQKVDRLTQQTASAPYPQRHQGRQRFFWLVYGMVLVAVGIVGHQVWPLSPTTPGLEALARDLDSTLVQGYTQLPKGLQDKINTLYSQHQFQAPGKRQQGGK
jgi:hypothetical protein